MDIIRIGTRGSRLALRQAGLVQEALLHAFERIRTEIVILHTKGDKILDRPMNRIGGKGIFVSEFEQALLEDRIDLAVHSAKDLPISLAEGLAIAAVLPRGDVRDVLVVPKGAGFPFFLQGPGGAGTYAAGRSGGKPENAPFIIGTGSIRRQTQAARLWDSVVCENIRGNVDSRLRKLEEGGYDGIILAKAGLDRLGGGQEWERRFDFYPLHPWAFLPAACQGIIAVEARRDSPIAAMCRQFTDSDTELCFLTEREVLSDLASDGGESGKEVCSTAAAVWCRREGENLTLDVMYGEKRCTCSCRAELEAGLHTAREAARKVKPG